MKTQTGFRAIFFVIGCLIINSACFAAHDIGEWRNRTKGIADDPTMSDSLKVIRMSDLAYNYYYYYRVFDGNYLDEFLQLSEPFTNNEYKDNLLSCIYSIAAIVSTDAETKQEMAEKCIYHTEKCTNPLISVQSWQRLGRMKIHDATGLSYFFKALDVLDGLDNSALESDIYGYISMYYSVQGDDKNEKKYADLSLERALKSGSPRHIMEAWSIVGESYFLHNDYPAAIRSYKEAIKVYLEQLKEVEQDPDKKTVYAIHNMVSLVNLGSMYIHNNQLDTATVLMTQALDAATRYNIVETQAYCHKELGNIYRELKQYNAAEQHFLKTEQLLSGEYVGTKESDHIDYEVKLALANLYHITGDYNKSASYYNTGIEKYRSMHDEEQLAVNQQLAASYETKKQEEAIAQREAVINYKECQRCLFFGVLMLILISLFFTVRLYRIRISLARRREQTLRDKMKMLEIEKRKAELDGELKQNEAGELKQKLALGNELREQRNKALEELTVFFDKNPDLARYQKQVESIILQQNRIDSNVEEFKQGVKSVPLDFYVCLQKLADNKLTSLDLKYCRLIYLETSSKDIADLLSVEQKTVRMNKYRLKQKLKLGKDDDLNEFIINLTGKEDITAC